MRRGRGPAMPSRSPSHPRAVRRAERI